MSKHNPEDGTGTRWWTVLRKDGAALGRLLFPTRPELASLVKEWVNAIPHESVPYVRDELTATMEAWVDSVLRAKKGTVQGDARQEFVRQLPGEQRSQGKEA